MVSKLVKTREQPAGQTQHLVVVEEYLPQSAVIIGEDTTVQRLDLVVIQEQDLHRAEAVERIFVDGDDFVALERQEIQARERPLNALAFSDVMPGVLTNSKPYKLFRLVMPAGTLVNSGLLLTFNDRIVPAGSELSILRPVAGQTRVVEFKDLQSSRRDRKCRKTHS